MRIVILIIFLTAVVLLLPACSDAVSAPEKDELLKISAAKNLYNTWVFDRYEEDTIQVMKKSAGLDENNYGFIFYSGGEFTERKNAGWCGTPPISYANFDGFWELEPDSIITINVGFWGGSTEYKIKVVSLTESEFRFIYVHN